ncbi:MAG: methyltransferase domain-containing protein [Deltaproteobacteria bacterium]|nr:methyltransferase domain-containing protein [Deltaproteobacteria bacterium]
MMLPLSRRPKRWQLAQKHQRANQLQKKAMLIHADAKSFKISRLGYAASLFKMISQFRVMNDDTKILEVGSGPHGASLFWPKGFVVALDPLACFYRKEFGFIQDETDALLCQGMGEHLPFPSAVFDCVISDNVLDHTTDAAGILKEIHRILKDDGLFLLSVNVHHMIYRAFSLLFDMLFTIHIIPRAPNYKTHTHFFTPSLIMRLLTRNDFRIAYSNMRPDNKHRSYSLSRLKPYKNRYSTIVCFKSGKYLLNEV